MKVILLLLDAFPFNSDEAIVGLMARHILNGARPVFFYGQAYMGSLDAYLVAIFFFFFGTYTWVIRLVQILLYLAVIISTLHFMSLLGLTRRVQIITACMLAIPSVNVTLYSTVSLGGYNEALLIGNLILIVCVLIYKKIPQYLTEPKAKRNKPGWWLISGLGFLIGFGLWVNGLTLVYAVPAGALILWGLLRNKSKDGWSMFFRFLIWGLAGFIIGSSPWWIFGLANAAGSSLLGELLGSAVAVESGGWFQIVLNHLLSFVLFGLTALFGLRPPWLVEWLAFPMIPFVILFWGMVAVYTFKRFQKWDQTEPGLFLSIGVMVTLVSGFIFTSFGTDPSGRYFLPLWIPFSILAAEMVDDWIPTVQWKIAAVCFIVVFHGVGIIQSAQKNPPGLTTQFDLQTVIDHRYDKDLIRFLEDKNETCGYSNYWVSYPLAFNSNEKLIFIPSLPYHQDLRYTPRDNRYKPYTDYVEGCGRVAYILTQNPALEKYVKEKFTEHDIDWAEESIGDYLVMYNLSGKVSPSEIGLGGSTELMQPLESQDANFE